MSLSSDRFKDGVGYSDGVCVLTSHYPFILSPGPYTLSVWPTPIFALLNSCSDLYFPRSQRWVRSPSTRFHIDPRNFPRPLLMICYTLTRDLPHKTFHKHFPTQTYWLLSTTWWPRPRRYGIDQTVVGGGVLGVDLWGEGTGLFFLV